MWVVVDFFWIALGRCGGLWMIVGCFEWMLVVASRSGSFLVRESTKNSTDLFLFPDLQCKICAPEK